MAAYLAANDVQRPPFLSSLGIIEKCLRGPDDEIPSCLDKGSLEQVCTTSVPQCATADEEAWQLYTAHYLRLLTSMVKTESPATSQAAWSAYVDAECSYQEGIYSPDEMPMRSTVLAVCRSQKARARALELRDSVINAKK